MWPAFLCFSHRSYLPYGWTTSPWWVKSKPFHLCLLRLSPQQQETPVVRLVCACGEDTTFPRASFSTYFLLSLAMCLPGTWVVSTASGSRLSGSAVVCRLSGERIFPFTWTPANVVLSSEVRTHKGCALFCLGAQASTGFVVIPEGGGQRAPRSPTPLPWPGRSRSSLVLPF